MEIQMGRLATARLRIDMHYLSALKITSSMYHSVTMTNLAVYSRLSGGATYKLLVGVFFN